MARTSDEQLAWERRAGRYAAAAAALAGVLFLVGSVWFNTTVRERPRGVDQELALLSRESATLLVSGVLVALGYLLLGAVLFYLYRATKHRRSQLPTAALALLVFGAVVASAAEVGRQLAVLSVASDFLASGPRNADRARDMLRGSTPLQVIGTAGLAANFALGLTMGLVCINAMRAGVLSVFMGIFGTLVGVLSVIAPPQLRGVMFILLFFWLLALTALFLDRWPGGRGPAWESGEAAPWPSVAQRNAELSRKRDELDDRAAAAAGGDAGGEPAAATAVDTDTPGADGGGRAPGARGNGSEPGAGRAKRKRGRSR